MPKLKLHPLLLLSAAILLPFLTGLFATLLLVVALQISGLVLLCLYQRPVRAFKMLVLFAGVFALYQGMLCLSSYRVFATIGMFALIFLRVLPAMVFVSLLLYDVEAGELVAALNQIRLPKNLVLGFAVVVRFLPTVQEEMRIMRQALRMRRVKVSAAKPMQAMEYLLVPVLFRTQILAEELAATAVTRGAQSPAKRTSLFPLQWRGQDTLFTAVLAATILVCIGIGGGA